MKRLLLVLAAISFSIPVFADWERYLGPKHKVYVDKGFNWDWVNGISADMVAVLAVILVILLVLLIILFLIWTTPSDEEMRAEERRKKLYKKEKLISYGHDMKGLEEKYRKVKIYREED
tara:strand:- start:1548 stop:1904 length:357 start_codon:yes stop_codon:yes gene_type:complete